MHKTIKSRVQFILKYFPQSRNSDVRLTIELWKQFYPEIVKDGSTGKAIFLGELLLTLFAIIFSVVYNIIREIIKAIRHEA